MKADAFPEETPKRPVRTRDDGQHRESSETRMETAARDRFKATRPALIETRQEVLARPWGNWDARAPPLELSRGVSPRDPASNPTPRCVPPKPEMRVQTKTFRPNFMAARFAEARPPTG